MLIVNPIHFYTICNLLTISAKCFGHLQYYFLMLCNYLIINILTKTGFTGVNLGTNISSKTKNQYISVYLHINKEI